MGNCATGQDSIVDKPHDVGWWPVLVIQIYIPALGKKLSEARPGARHCRFWKHRKEETQGRMLLSPGPQSRGDSAKQVDARGSMSTITSQELKSSKRGRMDGLSREETLDTSSTRPTLVGGASTILHAAKRHKLED
jgi:hypothetical protein